MPGHSLTFPQGHLFHLISQARRMFIGVASIVCFGGAGLHSAYGNIDTYKALTHISDVFRKAQADYVKPLTAQELMYGTLNGMLYELDPHSAYLSEKDFQDLNNITQGVFSGIGVEVVYENKAVKVVTALDSTPAERAGLKTGDYIIEINDEPVSKLGYYKAVEQLKGPPGSFVEIKVIREGMDPFLLKLQRDTIAVDPLRDSVRLEDTAYIRISSFIDASTADLFKKTFLDQKKQSKEPLKGIVLDLRNNPGGILEQGVKVAGYFVGAKKIVTLQERSMQESQIFKSSVPKDITSGLPVVVLINSGSASAAEIVAGALQDYKRAVVLGVPSFGKGSVQTVTSFPGKGAMILTTAQYYTPSNKVIQGKGIKPDILVEEPLRPVDDLSDANKVKKQPLKFEMRESNLPGALNTPYKKIPATVAEGEATIFKAVDTGPKKVDPSKDVQLQRAIDLIHGLSVIKKTSNK